MKSQFKIILSLLICCSIISSCNKAMRLEKKSEKLAQKAMVDPVAFKIVGGVYIGLNPCPPSKDSIVYGKPDTVTTTVGANNDYLFVVIDSLLRIKCPTLNVDSFRTAIKKTIKPDIIYRDIAKVDTFFRPDLRQINELTKRNSYLEGQNETLKQQLIKADNKNDYLNRKWWITLAAAIVVIGGLIFIIFKK